MRNVELVVRYRSEGMVGHNGVFALAGEFWNLHGHCVFKQATDSVVAQTGIERTWEEL